MKQSIQRSFLKDLLLKNLQAFGRKLKLPVKLLAVLCILTAGLVPRVNAQVNGTATEPIVSTDPNDPIYFYLESASDASFTLASWTIDARGQVMISPAASGTKLGYNTLASAPTADHALWYIVNEGGINVLKNKATGLYMNGSYNASSTSKEFAWTSLGTNQFLIRTKDAGSYTCVWKDQLCNRYSNQGLNPNSLAAWYFIVADPQKLAAVLKLSLLSKINACNTLLNNSKEGTDFGQYPAGSRENFLQSITNAQSVYDDSQSTIDVINTVIQFIDQAKVEYMAAENTNPVSLLSTDTQKDRWYWIRSYATASAYCFDKVISTGGQTVGSKYTYEVKASVPTDNQLFRFELTEDKTKVLNIIDKKGNRMRADGSIGAASTDANDFALQAQPDGIAFWIQPTTLSTLYATEGGTIANWKYMSGGASSWIFEFAMETPKLTKPRTVTVNSADAAMGAVEITDSAKTSVTNMDERVSVKAMPVAGYFFKKWTNLAGDSVSIDNPYIYTGTTDTTLVAHFENGYYRDMKRYYTSSTPSVQSADRYLTDMVATVNGVDQVIFTGVATIPNPIDPAVQGMTLIGDAIVDCKTPEISIPAGTASFDLKCIGSSVTIENLKWTQQNAFIDWNKDFDFVDEGEYGTVYTTGADFVAPTGYVRTITIPANTPIGTYRMRVIYHEPSTAADWSVSIWSSNNIRNGVAYEMLVRVTPGTGLKNTNEANISVSINSNKMKIRNAENSQMTVCDLTGRAIDCVKVNSSSFDYSAPTSKGVYLLTFKQANGSVYSTKVVR